MDQDDFESWLSDHSDEAVHVAGSNFNPTSLKEWIVRYFAALRDLATEENEIEESEDEDDETIPLADDDEED